MFEKTITIEHQKDRIFKFTENMNKFHNKFVFNDLKSRFIYGLSHETSCVEKIDKVLNGEKYEKTVYKEDSQTNPRSPYAITKLDAENYLRKNFNNKLTNGLFGFLKIVNTGMLFLIAVIGATSQFAK